MAQQLHIKPKIRLTVGAVASLEASLANTSVVVVCEIGFAEGVCHTRTTGASILRRTMRVSRFYNFEMLTIWSRGLTVRGSGTGFEYAKYCGIWMIFWNTAFFAL